LNETNKNASASTVKKEEYIFFVKIKNKNWVFEQKD